MSTFIDTVNAGAYYLNGVPFAGGGGGGGGGLGVPLFAVVSSAVLSTGPITVLPPTGAYFVTGMTTSPYTPANKMCLVHGFDNSGGQLQNATNTALTFECQREGMHNFTMSIAGQGDASPSSYSGAIGIFITQNGKSVAFNTQRVIGTNTTYSDRLSISVDTYLMPSDVVQFGTVFASPGADTWEIDSIILTGTLLNHPPSDI